ncbi:MAG: M28 family peptidase [Bacteroidota bacterium]
MNKLTTAFFLLLLLCISERMLSQEEKDPLSIEIETHLRFLASDELEGRATGMPGNDVAAAYISAYFRANGLNQVPNAVGYGQEIPFVMTSPPASASFSWGDTNWEFAKDFIVSKGKKIELEAEAVFVDYGLMDEDKGIDDYEGLDLKGKIVIANLGAPGVENPGELIRLGNQKRAWVAERGGIALVELWRQSRIPWRFATMRLNRKRLQIAPSADLESPEALLTHIWAEDKETHFAQALNKGKGVNVQLKHSGVHQAYRGSKNILGYIEGTDPELKQEYLLITAHYDHVGTGPSGGRISPTDSIFNGARDNAIGTVSLMTAAKLLAANPPRRSVLFLAVTAEEIGLLGSAYYAANPLLPLKDMVFDLNCDGAGYNDKTSLTVIGFNHVDFQSIAQEAAQKFELNATDDPVPQQNLYDRSDNASFAAKGIPSVNVSPGVKAFDQELMKYYHQVADEAESLDFDYVARFVKSFAEIASILANADQVPTWREESKYAGKGKELYEK